METALSQALFRQEWVNACHFHDLTEGDVLREVARRVADLKAHAGGSRQSHPLVLLDLDSTLYEVGPRTWRILQEWTDTAQSQAFHSVREALHRLEEGQVGYSVRDTLATLGLATDSPEVVEAIRVIKGFWASRFFTSAYLEYDRSYPGAADFARKVHELGAEVVYLTGRDEPGMGEGTRANLLRDGFPWEAERTHLLLKPDSAIPDLDHKVQAAHYVRKHGTLVASFENEPPNLVALFELFPGAMHVFVDTVCSDRGAMPCRGLYRIAGFSG